MKKVLLSAALVASTVAVSAQKVKKNATKKVATTTQTAPAASVAVSETNQVSQAQLAEALQAAKTAQAQAAQANQAAQAAQAQANQASQTAQANQAKASQVVYQTAPAAAEVTSKEDYKPVAGSATAEVGLFANNVADLHEGIIKVRYFFKNDLALRVGLGVNSTSSKSSTGGNPIPVVGGVDPKTEIVTNNSATNLHLGVEKHFAGSNRLSTYVAADLLVGYNTYSSDVTRTVAGVSTTSNLKGGNNAGMGFGVRVSTGADYYIAKKLYMGVEAGLGYMYSSKNEQTGTSAGVTSTIQNASSTSGAFTKLIGGLKLGYQF